MGLYYFDLVMIGGNITFVRKICWNSEKITNFPDGTQYVNRRSSNLNNDVSGPRSTFCNKLNYIFKLVQNIQQGIICHNYKLNCVQVKTMSDL